ncbi:MAG TPA: IS21 family transposase [Sedimenticola sp.]|nr:IS21 family transposase [Sedimenticola sp.]
MKKIHDVLRLHHEAHLSHRKIARACGISKGVVSKYLALAKAQGITWPLPEGWGEAELEARLHPDIERPIRFIEPDFPAMHQELKRKEVTLQLLWSEYAAVHGPHAYRYSQYCHHYRRWQARQKRSMRQLHKAGEKLFIDYCGPTVPVVDRHTGELRQAQVFVAVLGASSYTYAEATWSQQLPDWIASHQRAFRFFGGTAELLIPDNLRSGVSRPCRYAPEPNETYQELARHYGTAILPARPYKPKDKAKAEVGVQVVERWILARLRHHTFFSLNELNQAIAALLTELNERPFQKLPGSRRSAFESLDRPALKPLPAVPYEYAEWKQARPGIDYHVEVDRHYYSVPHRWVGQVLDVRATAATVEFFHKGQRVASHPRAHKGGFSTLPEHMPRLHRQHREWSPGRFLNWAREIGPCTLEVVKRQLEGRPHPEHGYRSCLGLLNHARRYSRPRLEAACARALEIHSPSYRSVTSILKQGLDQQPLPDDETAQGELPLHANVRGPGYYH